jgi:hypothetical protein
MPFIARNPERYLGKTVGTGHCIAYVRETSGAPITTQWRRGDPVRGSGCAPGTAIATFDPSGRYGNHVDGRSHAAILIAETDEGLLVCDQWIGQLVQHRTIQFRNGEGKAADDGDRFYVVEMA